MFDIITGGVLCVCNCVVKCFREKQKKRHTAPVSFLFLTGVSVHETHLCTAFTADVLCAVFQRHA